MRNSTFASRRSWQVLSVLVAAAFLGGCSSVGPCSVPKDRFCYGNAMSRSAKEQILNNLVRMRYLDAPVFVDVSSVISQYAIEGSGSVALGFSTGFTAGDTQSLTAQTHWADRPTITYVPLKGSEFSRSIMTPLTPEALFALVQAGWPPEYVLGLTVRSINGLKNDTSSPTSRQTADPAFLELVAAWRRLRDAGALAFRLRESEGVRRVVVFAQGNEVGDEVRRDLSFVRDTLGLSPEAEEYEVVYGLLPAAPNQIAVLTRSTFEILANLAWFIDAPDEHVCEGRTLSRFRGSKGTPMIRARVASKRPTGAYAAVKNRDYWFYVDDADRASKRTFMLMEVIMSLADRGSEAHGPVVSIGN